MNNETEDHLRDGCWQTFDLLMTPSGFDQFKQELVFLNQKKPQVYVHVCNEGILNNEVLRIGKAKNGVIDRWIKQSWGHGNTFLWSIGESERYASYAARYPNYLAFFASLTGLNTKLYVLTCESTESMNQTEKDLIKYFHPIWESYKKTIRNYFLQYPESKLPISNYGGARKEILRQRNETPPLSLAAIPDVTNSSGTATRKWKDISAII